MNVNLFKAKLAENGLTQKDAAAKIGVASSTFNAKANGTGGAEFTLKEVKALRALLGIGPDLSDAIFFS